MQDKLEKLFKQIGLEEECYSFFDNASLEKIVLYNDNRIWEFVIRTNSNIPFNVYNCLLEKLVSYFVVKDKIVLSIVSNNYNNDYIYEYFNIIVNSLIEDSVRYQVFKDRKITVSDNSINIDVYNKIEKANLIQVSNLIKERLKRYGYVYDLNINLVEDGDSDINKLIHDDIEVINLNLPTQEVKEVKKENVFRSKKSHEVTDIKDLLYEVDNVNVEALIFGIDLFEAKSGYKIFTLKITDKTDSMYAKVFTKDDDEFARLNDLLKTGNWYRFYGKVQMDRYANEVVFMTRFKDIEKIENKKENEVMDDALEKRVELHAHTMMSQMDGVVSAKDLIKKAIKWGHKAIAVTDHSCAQAFPDAFHMAKDIKVLYGCELSLVDDDVDICFRETDDNLLDQTYVVFDFETTGLSAGVGDSIIEIGAVKICNGEIIDRFDELINPGKKLPAKIVELTHITDEMLKDKDNEENAVKRFISWFGDLPMVAHNAKFDVSFLEMAYKKYNLGEFSNTVIDTLELSRAMNPTLARHSLSALVKRYSVAWDESAHHRADYDAEGTAYVLHKMLKELENRNIEKISQLNAMINKEELHTMGIAYHFTMLAQNIVGLKNMFKIISYANTISYYKGPRVLRSMIEKYREGILIGSACVNGEIFDLAKTKSDEELAEAMKFYDYIEVQPPSVCNHLVQTSDFSTEEELINNIKKIIRVGREAGKIVVATGDVHHLNKEDKIYREIIINQKVPGGGRHPLNKKDIKEIPSMHFRTTNEMLEEFSFLDKDIAYEIVVTNTNKVADSIEAIEVIRDTGGHPFSPKIENSEQIVRDLVYGKAREIYGDDLPELIANRLERELNGIIGGHYDVIYLIAQKLVKKSNDDGYIVGSRGSVGSSLVATMMGITEVNPLPAHYVCPNCHKTIFELDGVVLSKEYPSGYDLPDRVCECGTKMHKEGQDIPFETFLGFNADKVPDIDLNFSSEYQAEAHEYTKVLFGEDYVYRAGTVGTVADKTAYGFVKGYFEDRGITNVRSAEIERLAAGCTGVKRTTGQHPGGIVVVPAYMDVFDFTPFQYPAEDVSSRWRTTQFEYHSIEDNLLKLDILGHDDPTMLKYLMDVSKMSIDDIPMDDKKVFSLFSSPEALGVTKEQIMCETGSLGLPETGTRFVINMLTETRPSTFGELVKVSGLSHGTNVWTTNAQELVAGTFTLSNGEKQKVPFKDVIGCRDDIMVTLMNWGIEPLHAFKIMEFVRKGKAKKDPETWQKWAKELEDNNIPEWYIESCRRIQYMFPKAHATAYIMMCCRVAWYKVYQPINYYAAYFSIRCFDFDIDTMINGYSSIKEKILELQSKGFDRTNKEDSILDVLASALEMSARGFNFANLNLYKSHYKYFVKTDDEKALIPPFRSIDGLGDVVAKNIYEEAKKAPFISVEDFQKRCKVSQTLIDKMRNMNLFDGMPETSQLTLF